MSYRKRPIPEEVAHKIYDVLAENLPLDEKEDDYGLGMDLWRYNFVQMATEGTWTEYRIGNPLGFGGKVWSNNGRWYVNCYPEDETAERLAIISRTNEALEKLRREVVATWDVKGDSGENDIMP